MDVVLLTCQVYLSSFCFQKLYFESFIIKIFVLHVLWHSVVFFNLNLQERFLHEKGLNFRNSFSAFIDIILWIFINIMTCINIFSNVKASFLSWDTLILATLYFKNILHMAKKIYMAIFYLLVFYSRILHLGLCMTLSYNLLLYFLT